MMNAKTKTLLILLALLTAALLLAACGQTADTGPSGAPAAEGPAEGETAGGTPAPATVTADWAEGADLSGCLEFEADTDSDTKVVFRTDAEVKDFALLSVFLEGVSESGAAEFSCETLYLQEKLDPDLPLVVNMTFFGDIPNYGIAYTDTDGTVRRFTVGISGKDGSLELAEF